MSAMRPFHPRRFSWYVPGVRFVLTLVLVCAVAPAPAQQSPVIGLITKTETNPFFVKMKEGAAAAASAKGAKLMTACRRDSTATTPVR